MVGKLSIEGGLVLLSPVRTTGQWTLTTLDDANWDADGDGLTNLCEYQWSLVKDAGLAGDLLESHLETETAASQWAEPDPNNVDSDGDGLP